MTNALERLVEQLRRLPGIGSKSARRLAYHLVEMPQEEVDPLLKLKGHPAIVLSVLIYLRRTLVNFALILIGIKPRLWWLKRLAM